MNWLDSDDEREHPDIDSYGLDPRAVVQKRKWCSVQGLDCTYEDCLGCEEDDEYD